MCNQRDQYVTVSISVQKNETETIHVALPKLHDIISQQEKCLQIRDLSQTQISHIVPHVE